MSTQYRLLIIYCIMLIHTKGVLSETTPLINADKLDKSEKKTLIGLPLLETGRKYYVTTDNLYQGNTKQDKNRNDKELEETLSKPSERSTKVAIHPVGGEIHNYTAPSEHPVNEFIGKQVTMDGVNHLPRNGLKQPNVIENIALTNQTNYLPGKAIEANVIGDIASFTEPSEPEACADDDTSADDDNSAFDNTSSTDIVEKEETYTSGVKVINTLSKEDKIALSNSEKKKKKKFTSEIDLKYLQNLFKGKNLEKFQKNLTSIMKNKSFEKLRKKLYNEESKLKILDTFDSLDIKTEKKINSLLEVTLNKEKESIRYKIDFPMFYHAVGTITLPFDDLVEPFEAWYAGELNMSRIDYYYGMDKSYQRGDIGKHGMVVKITPAHWNKKSDLNKNTISCWYKEESKWAGRRGQTIVPMNIKKFKFDGEDHFNGVPTYKFTFQKRFVNKNNTYTLHVSQSKPYKPIRYEMIGYDHLLRSHYDHYIIDYFLFEPWKFDYNVLQIPKSFKCYKKLHKMKSHFEANPMWDFLHGEEPGHREHELNKTYELYKKKHSKKYEDRVENHKRKDIFRHNTRFVNSKNRAKLNFTLELNHLSDLSEEEFELMKGQPNVDTVQMQNEINDIPQLRLKIPTSPLPKTLDWRDYGAVSPVHSQSFCASCWAFSAVGAIEAAFAIQNGSLEELAVQELIDCSWAYENHGCRGGWSWRALKFVGEHGLATKKSYGKYLGQEGYCHCGKKDNCDVVRKISYRTIQKHNAEKLKIALATFGPGSISVFCARKTFKFYSSGIYDDKKCGHKTDHAVVAIGYGEENGIPYWLIKNSWGRLWGNDGYIKIAMKKDLCGVLQNGALMVSLNNWKDSESSGFPFQKMKKNINPKIKTKNFNDSEEQEKLDLFSFPNHVTKYIQENQEKTHITHISEEVYQISS